MVDFKVVYTRMNSLYKVFGMYESAEFKIQSAAITAYQTS